MCWIYFILSVLLFGTCLLLKKITPNFIQAFQRKSFAVKDLLKQWMILYFILSILSFLIFIAALLGWFQPTKFIAFLLLFLILLVSAIQSFRLLRHL